MVYSSFLSPYGPALDIQEKFEKDCSCHLRWMKVEDSTLMAQRLKLRSDGLGVDVVLGLDQMTLFEAENKWKKISVEKLNFNEIGYQWIYKTQKTNISAIPITWAPLTFISRTPLEESKNSLETFESLLHSKWEKGITLPHPRSSTLGLQFYFWIFSLLDDKIFEFLNLFKKQVYTFSHSWSNSYGFFQKGLVDLTFSYQTSLIYHLTEEDQIYYSLNFSFGHPYQVEFAVIPQTCKECELANQFIQFLLREDIQKILMEKNYMLPIMENVSTHTPFEKLNKLKLISYKKMEDFLNQKKSFLQKF